EVRAVDLEIRILAELPAVFGEKADARFRLDVGRDRRVAAPVDRPVKRLLVAKAALARGAELWEEKAGLPLRVHREDRVRQVKHGHVHDVKCPAADLA